MYRKVAVLIFILLLTGQACCFAQAAQTGCDAAESETLEFINASGTVIEGVYVRRIGSEVWSDNLLGEKPLGIGEKRKLNISRSSIIGLCDIRLVYGSGKERIWGRLPLAEIFSITHKIDGLPEYERIRLST
jgi:hypothetical protein